MSEVFEEVEFMVVVDGSGFEVMVVDSGIVGAITLSLVVEVD